jgi:hypothetical protein
MEHNEHKQVVATCKRLGYKDTDLWASVLTHFASQATDCPQELIECLQIIDEQNLMKPLQVIQIFAKNSMVELAIVKEYILKRIQKTTLEIESDEKLIQSYREETTRMKQDIQTLKNS